MGFAARRLLRVDHRRKGKNCERQSRVNQNPEGGGDQLQFVIKLKSAGKVIGVQCFHFENRETVTEKTIELANSITDLIAAAIAVRNFCFLQRLLY